MTNGVEESYWLRVEFDSARRQRDARRQKSLINQLMTDLEEKTPGAGRLDIEQYLAQRFGTATTAVDQVRHEIDVRLELAEQSLKQLDAQITYATLSLESFAGWGVGYNTGVDVKRN